jgi:uncharacterized protein YxeA
MKKTYIKIVGLVVLMTALTTSCKKFVDYNPHEDFVTTELDYLKTE